MICYQRTIRTERGIEEGCALGDNPLRDCTIEQITRSEASEIIMRYEWLRSMPQVGRAYYGLFTPGKHVVGSHQLIGAVCFGEGPSTQAKNFCAVEDWNRVICLERGACAPIDSRNKTHADNAASYLITHACRTAFRDYGWGAFFAYSDMEAGEIGTVYQAAGWHYLGRGTKRGKYRTKYKDKEGNLYTSRRLRAKKKREGYEGTLETYFPEVLEPKGWTRWKHPEKHKYIHILDPTLKFRGNPWIGPDGDYHPYPKRDTSRQSIGASLNDWKMQRFPTYTRYGENTEK